MCSASRAIRIMTNCLAYGNPDLSTCPREPLRKEDKYHWVLSALQKEKHLFSAGFPGLGTCRPHLPRAPLVSALGRMPRCTPAPVCTRPQSGNGGSRHAVGPLLSQDAASRWSGGPMLSGGSSCLLCIFGEKTVLSPTSEASICCTNSLLK